MLLRLRHRATALAGLLLIGLLTLGIHAARPAFAQPDGGLWFEVDRLNPALPPPPDRVDRSTPHATVSGFLDALARDDPETAAHYIDLTGVPGIDAVDDAARIARMMGAILDQRVGIDWADLPDRPDALNPDGASGDPMTGTPRRSIRLAMLDLDGRTVSFRLERVAPAGGDPVWVFARSSAEHVEALHAVYGPGWLETRLPDVLREPWIGGLDRWEALALPLLLGIAGVLFSGVRVVLGGIARKLPHRLAVRAAMAARTPAALFITALAADYVTTELIGFSAPIATILAPLLLAATVCAIAWALIRAIDTLLDVVTERYVGEIDDAQSADDRSLYTSIYAARRVVLLLAVVFAVGAVLMQLHMFESIGVSLLASAGFVTVILGIAGHAVLGNILSSLQIALAKPIRIGDSVLYEGDWAYVESIYYTFVRLRTWDNRRLIVPVKYFVAHPFENWSMQDAKMTRTFTLLLDHDADIDKLREVFMAQAEEDEHVMDGEMTKVLAMDHDAHGLHLRFYATAPDPTRAWEMHARLREAMITWIRRNHPEWWPRERVLTVGGRDQTAEVSAAAAE